MSILLFGVVLMVIGFIALLSWSWWRERKMGFNPAHSRKDIIVITSSAVTVMLGAGTTITMVLIEIGKFLCQ